MNDTVRAKGPSSRKLSSELASFNETSASGALGWAYVAMVALGLVGVLLLGAWTQKERLSLGRTATVVAEAQVSMLAMAAHAEGVEKGVPGAFASMQQARSELAAALTTLEQGRPSSMSDPVAVLPLGGRRDIPLGDVRQALSQFEQGSRVLVENAGALERAGAADATLAPALEKISSQVSRLVGLPSFSSGVWRDGIAPLETEWKRPELQTMTVVFAPMPGADKLQAQWAARFRAQAEEVKRLSDLASRDSRVSVADRHALADFAKEVATVASSASVLAETTPVRLLVKKEKEQWKKPLDSGSQALDKVSSAVFGMARGRGIGTYIVWFLGLVGLVGLALLAKDWHRKHKSANLISQESVLVQHGQEQFDQITRQLRRIVPGDGPIQRGLRLNEDADSSAFPLATMVNRILDTFDSAENEIKEQALNIDVGLATGLDAGTNLATQSQRSRQVVSQAEASIMELAKEAARLAHKSSTIQALTQAASEHLANSVAIVQQGIYKADALRENTQDSSKRIKRLSESAQAISMSVDLIYRIIEQVQVLSMNVAIEAANAGEQGRNFVVISQEIQRLVSKGTAAAREIDKVIESILTDAKETVSAMEMGTAEVVETSKISNRAYASLRDMEKEVATLAQEVPRMEKDLEKQAVKGAQIVDQVQAIGRAIGQASADAAKAQETFSAMRAITIKIVRFVEQGGSRSLWRRGKD